MQLPAAHADFEQARNLNAAGETSKMVFVKLRIRPSGCNRRCRDEKPVWFHPAKIEELEK